MLGYQVCIDLFDCDAAALDAPAEIEAAVRTLAAGIGASVVAVSTHRFAPQGLSCIAQISASHIAIHTWPENGFAAVDAVSSNWVGAATAGVVGIVTLIYRRRYWNWIASREHRRTHRGRDAPS